MTVRENLRAEEIVLGAALFSRPAVEKFVSDLAAEDFYRAGHANAFAAVVELYHSGNAVNCTTVADLMRRHGTLETIGGPAALSALVMDCTGVSEASSNAIIIRREAAARKLAHAFAEGQAALESQQDPVEVAETAQERLNGLDRGSRLPERFWRSTDDYRAEDHTKTVTPLAEGVCYPLSRIMVIALEKGGKSVLLRQIAFCMAAGIHPFNPRIKIDPVRTLLFDAENDDDELVQSMERIHQCIDASAGPDALRPALYSVPYGVDFELRRDRGDFFAVLEDFKPQIIVGGPVYKLTDQTKDYSEDRRAAIVQKVFNQIRQRWGSAVLLEHHAPTGDTKKTREVRAKGGQVWPAWVNMTVGLHAVDEGESFEVKYPHPPRGKFRWPRRFDRGRQPHEWPWTPVLSQADATPVAQGGGLFTRPSREEPEYLDQPF